MRTKCPRCQYPHNVDAADMVSNMLDDPAHNNKTFITLPTKRDQKLFTFKAVFAEDVMKVYADFKEGRLIEAPKKKAAKAQTSEAESPA